MRGQNLGFELETGKDPFRFPLLGFPVLGAFLWMMSLHPLIRQDSFVAIPLLAFDLTCSVQPQSSTSRVFVSRDRGNGLIHL
jgi:hypothetical protein